MSSVLQELGPEAVAHRDEIEEIKRRMGIRHDIFDGWIYGFLENKKFNIDETFLKLQRREQMERNELANYDITDYMRETMAKGIIQLIGEDKEGRIAFYIVTKRDFPTAKRREENKRNFDMWLSYGTRLRKESKRCRICMLINQKDASMWSNTDMTFQADVALRIAKYYPGVVDRMYITKMSNTLATMAKPIFSRLPAIVSDRIRIFTESDLQHGKLLELFDEHVLPVDLGGKNDCDGPRNWTAFANTIEDHFTKLKHAVAVRGLNVKEWELECLQKELAENAATAKEKRHADLKAQNRASALGVQSNAIIDMTPRRGEAAEDAMAAGGGGDGGSDVDDDQMTSLSDLKSCYSDDEDDYIDENSRLVAASRHPSESHFGEPEALLQQTYGSTRLNARFPPTMQPLHRFLLEEERRWRQSIANDEAECRLRLCDRRMDSYNATNDQIEDVFGAQGSRRLASLVPAPARSMVNFFLQCCCMLSAVYFAAGTIFCTAVACSVIVTCFFGMFAYPTFVFPVGNAMLLAGLQGFLLCSRGIELTRLSYYGRLFPGFRNFGAIAPAAQLLFTFALILTQLIIFIVYAVQWDTLNGLKVAFATGWLSGTLLIVLHHLLYFLQSGEAEWDSDSHLSSSQRRSKSGRSSDPSNPFSGNDNSKGALPIYLFFDITEEEDDEVPAERTSALLLVLFPVVCSFLFGVGFLVSKILALAVALPVATLTAAWAVNAYVDDATQRYHAVPTKFVVWLASIVWIFDCYTFGFREYSTRWVAPVLAASMVLLFFILAAIVAHRKGNSSRILRVVLLLIVAYVLACGIMCFVCVHWSLGVFSLVMAIHCGLCYSRNSGYAVSISGRFVVSAATALVIIASVMLGWIGTTTHYDTPQALNASTISNRGYTSWTQGYTESVVTFDRLQVSALCGVQLDVLAESFSALNGSAGALGSNGTLGYYFPTVTLIDVMLLNELTAAFQNPDVFYHDFHAWFYERNVSFSNQATTFPADTPPGENVVLSAMEYNFTIPALPLLPEGLVARNVSILVVESSNRMESIQAMTGWAEAICLSPLSIFLPTNWTSNVIGPYSFTTFMIPFRWLSAMSELGDYLAGWKAAHAASPTSPLLYLSGTGLAGGLIQIIGAKEEVSSIGWNAPGIQQLRRKFSIPGSSYDAHVLTVFSNDAALTTIGGSSRRSAFEMPCASDADTCQGGAYLARTLLERCEVGSGARRHA